MAISNKVHSVIRAFERREKHRIVANTSTDGSVLRLHGNAIARWTVDGALRVSLAGLDTPLTRGRLNLLKGVHVSRANGLTYLNFKEWEGDWRAVPLDRPAPPQTLLPQQP